MNIRLPSVTTRKEHGPHGLHDEVEQTSMINMMYGSEDVSRRKARYRSNTAYSSLIDKLVL